MSRSARERRIWLSNPLVPAGQSLIFPELWIRLQLCSGHTGTHWGCTPWNGVDFQQSLLHGGAGPGGEEHTPGLPAGYALWLSPGAACPGTYCFQART